MSNGKKASTGKGKGKKSRVEKRGGHQGPKETKPPSSSQKPRPKPTKSTKK